MLTDNVALAVTGSLALVLIGILALVMRSIISGQLMPRETVEEMRARDAERIAAQAEAIAALPPAVAEITATQRVLSESFADLADAAQLQVRLADALQRSVDGGGHAE